MAGMIGADLEQVRTLAADFDRAAAQLNQTSATVRNGIKISAWVGPFAVRFRHTWDSDHSVRLRQAANALAQQARQLRLEADQQEATSAASTAAAYRAGAISDRDLVDFAQKGTSNWAAISKEGYTALTDSEIKSLGIDPAMLHDAKSGFDAKIYRDQAGRIIVAFGGTEPSQVGDIDSDLGGLNHYWMTRQGEKSVELALTLKGSVGSENLILTGHSLGGRNAALASVATDARAVTFNAAGVSSADYTYAATAGGKSVSILQYAAGIAGMPLEASNVVNYYTTNDPLTTVQVASQAPDAVGTQRHVASDKYGLAAHSDFEALERGVPDH